MATRRVAKKESEGEVAIPPLHSNVDAALQAKIVEHLKQNHRVAAIQLFRLATGENLDVATNSLLTWWNTTQTAMIDTSLYPEVCCFNCLGCCGKRAGWIVEFGPKLYDAINGRPMGSDGSCCHHHLGEEQLKKMKRPTVHIDNPRTGHRDTLTLDNPIVEVVEREGTTYTIFTNDTAFAEYCKALRLHFDAQGVLRDFRECATSKRINKIAPLDNEKWTDYLARIQSSARERRMAVVKRMEEMDDATVITELKAHFEKKGLKEQMAAYPTFDSFFQTFYPDTEPRDLLFLIEREESGT